jgi:hypothetical protein
LLATWREQPKYLKDARRYPSTLRQ